MSPVILFMPMHCLGRVSNYIVLCHSHSIRRSYDSHLHLCLTCLYFSWNLPEDVPSLYGFAPAFLFNQQVLVYTSSSCLLFRMCAAKQEKMHRLVVMLACLYHFTVFTRNIGAMSLVFSSAFLLSFRFAVTHIGAMCRVTIIVCMPMQQYDRVSVTRIARSKAAQSAFGLTSVELALTCS